MTQDARSIPVRSRVPGAEVEGAAGKFLARASTILASSLDVDATLRNVARAAVPDFADWCAVDLLEPTGVLRRVAVAHQDPRMAEAAIELQRRWPPDPASPHGAHAVVRTGRSQLLAEISPDTLRAASTGPEHLAALEALALRSAITVALPGESGALGAITFVVSDPTPRRYDEADLALAEELALCAAAAVDRARLHAETRASRERMRALLDGIDGVVWEADAATLHPTFVSRKAEALLGHPARRWTEEPGFRDALVHPDDREWVARSTRERAKAGNDFELEYRMVSAGGAVLWVLERVFVERDPSGRPSTLRGILLDITERKHAERRFAAQHEVTGILAEATDLVEAAPSILAAIGDHLGWEVGALWTPDADGRLACRAFWSQRGADAEAFEDATRRLRLGPNEGLPGRAFASGHAEWMTDPAHEPTFVRVAGAKGAGLRAGIAFPVPRREGARGVVEFFTRDARPPDARLLAFLDHLGLQVGELLERRDAERAERESNARRGAILSASLDAIVTIDAEGRVTEWNLAAEESFGYSRREALGRPLADLIVPERLREAHRKGLMRAVRTREYRLIDRRMELPAMRRDGTEFEAEVAICPIAGTEPPMFTGFIRDISERKRLEDTLRQSEERYRSLVDASAQIVWTTPPDGRVEDMPTWRAYTGQTEAEVRGHGWRAAVHAEDRARLDAAWAEAASDGAALHAEARVRRADGAWRTMSVRAVPIRDAQGAIREWVGTNTDVEDQKTAQKRLGKLLLEVEEQRRRLQAIVGTVPGVVWEAWGSPDAARQRIDFVSDHVEEMLGYTVEEWLATPNFWLQVVHPEDRERAARESAAVYQSGGAGSIEFRWVRKDGGILHVVANSVAIKDAQGKPVGMRGVTLDVTAQHRALEAIKRSDERFHLLARATNDSVRDWDLAADAVWWNESFYLTFGYEAGEVEPGHDSWTRRVHPDDAARVVASLDAALAGRGHTWSEEYRFRRQDGEHVHVLDRGFIARDDRGRARRMISSMMDVTERRRAEDALARLAAIVQHSDDAIYGKGVDGRITDWNPGAERLYGYARDEIVGRPIQTVVPPDRIQEEQEVLARVTRGESVPPFETVRVRKDGSHLDVSLTVSPLRDAHGRIVGASAIARDVTQRKRVEAQLAQRAAELLRLTAALERSNRELDQFAYVTSHDLKAPLRGIANLASWIEEDLGDAVTPEARGHLDLLRGRVHRMESLIDAILQYSRVGRVEAKPEEVRVDGLLRETVDLLAPPEGFRVEVEGPLPTLVAERSRLQQVFMNLVGNALKHHHDAAHGSVRVSAEDAGAFWRFTVADDGPGIAPRFHDKVFVIFQTLEARDKVEGTGVGLALVKKIVQTQGGSVELSSDEGQGATFRFTWPKTPRAEREGERPA